MSSFHELNAFEYSLRRSKLAGLGQLSSLVVGCNVEQNWEIDEIDFKLDNNDISNLLFMICFC